jgi:hypothetical protein
MHTMIHSLGRRTVGASSNSFSVRNHRKHNGRQRWCGMVCCGMLWCAVAHRGTVLPVDGGAVYSPSKQASSRTNGSSSTQERLSGTLVRACVQVKTTSDPVPTDSARAPAPPFPWDWVPVVTRSKRACARSQSRMQQFLAALQRAAAAGTDVARSCVTVERKERGIATGGA